MTDGIETLRSTARVRVIETFGTGYIFRRRADAARRKLRWLAFMGIAVPLSVGGVVTSFGANSPALPYVLALAGVLGIAQLVMSAWALSAKWDDTLAYSLESTTDNNRLATAYDKLAKSPPPDAATRFEVLEAENAARDASDLKQGVSEREHRMGMRAALRQFKQACDTCKKVPTSMEPTNCDTCGNF